VYLLLVEVIHCAAEELCCSQGARNAIISNKFAGQGHDPLSDSVLAKPSRGEELGGVGASHLQLVRLHDPC